jgi:N-acetylneuraminate synthase/N,N'-diacetyllegionaminate synthase
MAAAEIVLGGRRIGHGHPCFVIAEAGVNHNGDLDLARRLVDCAAEAGADAVKFQSFQADQLCSPLAEKAAYQKKATDPLESQLAMLRRLELSPDAHRALRRHCEERRILFLSSPFDPASVDLLCSLGVPAFKLGSGEVTNAPLLAYAARQGKPILLSTGMSYLGEVEEALGVLGAAGASQVALFHCVSAYPADPGDANLRAMSTMAAAFHVPVGFSDHTPGLEVALAAVASGASLLEKHFTLDKSLPGPDHAASLEPSELRALVRGVRIVEQALGSPRKAPTAAELPTRTLVRRSLAAASHLPAGTELGPEHLTSLRPATGISAHLLAHVLGRKTRRALEPRQFLAWRDLE